MQPARAGAYLEAPEPFTIGGVAAQFVALANATEARLSALEAFAVTHQHVSAAPGNPTTPGPSPFVPVATPVASSSLKADP